MGLEGVGGALDRGRYRLDGQIEFGLEVVLNVVAYDEGVSDDDHDAGDLLSAAHPHLVSLELF